MLPILIIDGDNVFRRFWYANSETAISSWRGLLSNYRQRFNVPDCQMCVVFDGEDTRDLPIKGYKANRSEIPEDLLQDLLEAERVAKHYATVIKIDGPEGDQVIYGVGRGARESGRDCYVVSSDKDMLQMIQEKPTFVRIIRPCQSGYPHVDSVALRKSHDLRPEQIPSFLAIVGDTADNIKGIKGIGQKGAIELLHRYGTLAGIMENLDTLPIKYKGLVESSMEEIVPIYSMVRLRHPAIVLPEPKPVSSKLKTLLRHSSV